MAQSLSCEDSCTYDDGVLFHKRHGKPVVAPVPCAPVADTHGHLTGLRLHDRGEALARAAFAGVRLLGVPVDPSERKHDESFVDGIDAWEAEGLRAVERLEAAGLVLPTFEQIASTDPVLPRTFMLAGVHPYGAGGFDDACRARMVELLDHERCWAVGEIGLDYTCDVPRDVQERVFREQLAMAAERNLPVELHIRDDRDEPTPAAHIDAARILADAGVPSAGCDLHCFTDDVDVVRPFVEMGCYVAFGGAATFRKSVEIREAACMVPLDRILSETDCPYMAPEPLRGEECEPAMTLWSAECVAQAREEAGVSTREQTYAAMWSNALRLFDVDAR